MKKIKRVLISSLTAVAVLAFTVADTSGLLPKNIFSSSSVSAVEYVSGDWSYVTAYELGYNDTYARLSRYNGSDTDIVVPTEIDGYSVLRITGINNENVESVTIPEGIISFSFKDCSNLKSISLPGSLKTFNCENSGITSITIPENVSLPSGAFKNCRKLETVIFPDTLTSITANTFEGCTNLKTVTIPDSVKIIGESAFKNSGITSLIIPKNVTEISRNAFEGCSNLQTVIFADSSQPVVIKENAFKNSGIKTLIIPENVTVIDANAFVDCSQLQSVIVRGGTQIKKNAFSNCNNLNLLAFEGSPSLQTGAFQDCTGLVNVNMNLDCKYSGSAFNGCLNLNYINGINAVCISPKSGQITLNAALKDFIMESFTEASDVGFINAYVAFQASETVKNVTSDSMSDMEKIKTLHDWVCNRVVYDYENITALKNQVDSSIFLNDSTVCAGYSRGYNILLQETGIESYCVHKGSIHAWNIVKLGNHYFHVDLTWDDQDGGWSYDWFLKSDAELNAAGDPHSDWTLYVPSSMHNYVQETLPECKYQMGDLNMDGAFDGNDLLLLNDYLLGRTDIDSGDIVLADLNFDGSIDSYDLAAMRRMLV